MPPATTQPNYTAPSVLARPAGETDRFVCYIDTLTLNLARPISGAMLAELTGRNGGTVKLWTPAHANSYHPHARKIALSQPTLEAMVYAKLNLPIRQIARVDFAIDEMAASTEAAHALLDQRWHGLSLKWGACYSSDKFGGETRYIAAADRSRGIAGYADRPSKITGAPCSHIELRLRNPRACRAVGLFGIGDLATIDLFDALAHNIRWTRIADRGALHEAVERRLARCRGLRGVVWHACRVELGENAPATWDKLPASFLWRWMPNVARQHLVEVVPPFTRDNAMIKGHTFVTPWNTNLNSQSLPQFDHSQPRIPQAPKQPREQPQEPNPKSIPNERREPRQADPRHAQSRNGSRNRLVIQRVRIRELVAVPRRRIVRVYVRNIRRGTGDGELSGLIELRGQR